MKYKYLAVAAVALIAGTLGLGGAQAANMMTGGAPVGISMQDGNVQQVKQKKWYKYNNNRRYYSNNRRYHRRYRHYDNDDDGDVFLGLGLLPFVGGYYGGYGGYSEPYYYDGGGGGHVAWCYNRYRTYNVRTNTFRGYDGYLHQCRSPYYRY